MAEMQPMARGTRSRRARAPPPPAAASSCELPLRERGAAPSVSFSFLLIAVHVALIILYGVFVRYADEADGAAPVTLAGGTQSGSGLLQSHYPFYQDVHVMVFVGFGFLMVFAQRYGFSAVGYNFVISAVALLWSILCVEFFKQAYAANFHTIRVNILTLVDGDFGAATVMITYGALLGKVGPAQLLLVALFEVVFYAVNINLGLNVLQTVDMGGSIYIHTFGAFFGLGCSWVMSSPRATFKAHPLNGASRTSDRFAMIGTLFLWMFWPSFNGAFATGASQHRVVINTVMALSGSCIAAFAASQLCRHENKFSMVDIQNATLAGGVAVGSSADLVVQPWAAVLIGTIAGTLSVLTYVYVLPRLERWLGLYDTCGVLALHGLPGVLGAVSGAISAGVAGDGAYGSNIDTIFPARGPPDFRDAGTQAGFQIAGLVHTLAISLVSGALTGVVAGPLLGRWLGAVNTRRDAAFVDEEYWEVAPNNTALGDDVFDKEEREQAAAGVGL